MKEIIEELRNYNAWRRGEEGHEMPNPTRLGQVIDAAIDALEAKQVQMPYMDEDIAYTLECIKRHVKRSEREEFDIDHDIISKHIAAQAEEIKQLKRQLAGKDGAE